MKNVSKVFSVLMLVLALLFNGEVKAQSGLSNSTTCTASTTVGSACVGSCNEVGVINYTISDICPSATVGFCVETINSNLCPSHVAIANVYVNGVFTKRGKISDPNASFSFKAPCGANIQVIAVTRLVDYSINCIQFGEVNFKLTR